MLFKYKTDTTLMNATERNNWKTWSRRSIVTPRISGLNYTEAIEVIGSNVAPVANMYCVRSVIRGCFQSQTEQAPPKIGIHTRPNKNQIVDTHRLSSHAQSIIIDKETQRACKSVSVTLAQKPARAGHASTRPSVCGGRQLARRSQAPEPLLAIPGDGQGMIRRRRSEPGPGGGGGVSGKQKAPANWHFLAVVIIITITFI
jgi:hypothetical protein